MDTLPLELVEEIAQHLTAQDLATSCAVCRRWREIFNNDSLWRGRCDPSLEETLRTTPSVVDPRFTTPELPEGSALEPLGQWRAAYMREHHLWNNWRNGNYKKVSHKYPRYNDYGRFPYFIFDFYLIERFDSSLRFHDTRDFPPSLLLEKSHETFSEGYNIQGIGENLLMSYNQDTIHIFEVILKDKLISYRYNFDFSVSSENVNERSNYYLPGTFVTIGLVIVGFTRNNPRILHILDPTKGKIIKQEICPKNEEYEFSDIFKSAYCDDVILVVSNDRKLSRNSECLPKVTVYIYSPEKLCFLNFSLTVEGHRYRVFQHCIHGRYFAIVLSGYLHIYDYRSCKLLYKIPNKRSRLGILKKCFGFVVDDAFKHNIPLNGKKIESCFPKHVRFGDIGGNLILLRFEYKTEIWKIGGKRKPQRLTRSFLYDVPFRLLSNRTSTRGIHSLTYFKTSPQETNSYDILYFW